MKCERARVQKRKATKSICRAANLPLFIEIDIIVFNHLNGCRCRCCRCLCYLACYFSKFCFGYKFNDVNFAVLVRAHTRAHVTVTRNSSILNYSKGEHHTMRDDDDDDEQKNNFRLLVCKDLLCFFFSFANHLEVRKKERKEKCSHVTGYNRV